MNESDILYERGDFWVAKSKAPARLYLVFKNTEVVAESESTGYPLTPDGLSVAKARVDYLHSRAQMATGIAKKTTKHYESAMPESLHSFHEIRD